MNPEEIGKKVGFVLSYCLFTTIIFLIGTRVYEQEWTVLTAVLISACVVAMGGLLRWLLK